MAPSWSVKLMAACAVVAVLGRVGVTAARADDAPESRGTTAVYVAASTALTVAHVPSKVAMCGASVVLGAFAYLLTFGRPSIAKDAAHTVKGVCTGPYIITPSKLREAGEETTGSHGTD